MKKLLNNLYKKIIVDQDLFRKILLGLISLLISIVGFFGVRTLTGIDTLHSEFAEFKKVGYTDHGMLKKMYRDQYHEEYPFSLLTDTTTKTNLCLNQSPLSGSSKGSQVTLRLPFLDGTLPDDLNALVWKMNSTP